jgi:PAS domain S-box-containing protein
MHRSRSIVGIALLASAIVLAMAGSAAHRSVQALSDASDALVHSKNVALTLEEVLSVLRDAETGQRGFLLTGDEAYLQPYTEALQQLYGKLSTLDALASADPNAAKCLARMEILAQRKVQELERTIRLHQSGHSEQALALVRTGAGRQTMDEIRRLVADMQRVEDAVIARQVRVEVDARAASRRSSLITTGLAILLMVLLVFIVRRDSSRVRASEARLATTLRSIGDAVVATDESGRVRLLNPVAEHLTGWPLSEAAGMPLEEIFRIVNEQTRQIVESPVAKVLREGKIVGLANHSVLIQRSGAEVAIEDSGAPIFDVAGAISGVVLVFRDASRERVAQNALREADRRKDEFLAILAHELRNPLAPIRQAAMISRLAGASEEQLRWSREVIERQVGHMARLLDDLLDVSRITRGTLEVKCSHVELGSIVEAAIETARPAIDARRHELIVEKANEPLYLEADPLRLAQVFGNLLTNAAKYTHSQGRIRLVVERQGESAVGRVIDNGIGLSPETLPSIFDMFVQIAPALDRTESGLGIGLALARGLVELHDGTIEAHSAGLGRGSELIVRLPLARATSAAPVAEPPVTPPRSVASPIRVLVADDNRDAAESLAMLLRLEGHEVVTAHDGEAAFSAIERSRPQLALLDIGMPKLNGYEMAARVRAQPWGAGITLAAITGWGQAEDQRKALAVGFDHHLVKPVDPASLLALCAQVAAPSRAR